MDFWIINICLAFLLCMFLAGIVIPQILLIAFRKRLFDISDERKIHQGVVPRLGGIAFKPVIFFSIALLLGIGIISGHSEMLYEIRDHARPMVFGFCSIMMLYVIGMADDLIGVRYRAKFIMQILCGMMLIAGGIWINNLHGILGIHAIPAWIGYPLTILIAVFIINAINLIDGIDGLASGLSSIACLFYGLAFFSLHQHIYAMLSFATLGVLVPFFYYNVFGKAEHGRKIFMGDTGSLTIGMILCFLGIKLALYASAETSGSANAMIVAFSPLLVPCCDVVRVFLFRIRNGQNPFLPDKNHIHHKLLALGIPPRIAMIAIVSFSLIFTLLNILLSQYINVNWILLGDISAWTLANIWLTDLIKRRQATSCNNKTK